MSYYGTYRKYEQELDFLGKDGCTCQPTEEEIAKGLHYVGGLRSKCDKCYLIKKTKDIQESCLCQHERPTLTEKGRCNDCGLINTKYATATNVAAGQVIAQHFLYECEYEENIEHISPCTRTWTKKKYDYCRTCKNTPAAQTMRRRFGLTPKTFRQSLEREILKSLVRAGGLLPNEEVARNTAENCMHSWMDFETESVYARRRMRPAHKYQQTKDWFTFLPFY